MAKDFTGTLNLPATDFPMRAALPQREPAFLEKWEKDDLYGAVMTRNEGKPSFILHDGPPYANGNIHIGHALNKILKDFIVRYKNMSGFRAPYVPGWDCHGLPTESAILKQNRVDRHKMTVSEFRNACADFNMKYINGQREQFKRLGVMGDWEHPYITLKPEFEAEQVKIFGAMAKKGYIYKGFKSVYWCPEDETALAEAEIEYQDDRCESIYVKFRVENDQGKLDGVCDKQNTYFVIWTTTTWTLPGNLAICLNADMDYVLLRVPSGEVYIVAECLAENVCRAAGITEYEVVAKYKGSFFELMTAKHPFLDRESVILNGEHVTADAGTGCVHTAPGFGADDFDICQKYDKAGKTDIGVIVPVDGRGYQTSEAGPYAGMKYSASDEAILNDMRESGALLASETIVHPYPHCWRCKKPIIYRATEQWFASVSAMTEDAVRACDDISWYPKWGKERMIAMIRERNDWCISRQRQWGVPLPIFYCEDCGEYLVNDATIARISDIFREKGSNAWYEMSAEELLPEGTVCPKCGCSRFTKEKDIMDVWFDSGSTHAAVLDQRPELSFPADVYLEGGDQYRGWFQSSMLTSIAAKGCAPYRQIITHGWTVDGEGKAMHKSAGNAVAPDEIIRDYGADILRLWVSSVDYTNDVKISKDILRQLSDVYRKIRNTVRILIANLGDFDPDTDSLPVSELHEIDRWILSRYNQLVKNVNDAYNRYEFHYIYHDINNFCTVDLSKLYIDITKDRVYTERADSPERRSAQTAMYIVLNGLTRLLAPLLAYTSEEIWQSIPHGKRDDVRSVMLNDVPAPDPALSFPELEAHWNRLFDLRDEVMRALETARADKLIGKSLEARIRITVSDPDAYAVLDSFRSVLNAVFIVSETELVQGNEDGAPISVEVSVAEGEKCDRCWRVTRDAVRTEDACLCARCRAIVQ